MRLPARQSHDDLRVQGHHLFCQTRRRSGTPPAFIGEHMKITNLVSSWTSRVPAAPGRCSRRCTRSRPPAGKRCVCAHTPRPAPASRGRIHIFAAPPQSLRQSLPSRADRRRRFPSRAWSPWEKRATKTAVSRRVQTKDV